MLDADQIIGAVRALIAARIAPEVTDPEVARSVMVALNGLDEYLHLQADRRPAAARGAAFAALADRARAVLPEADRADGDPMAALAAMAPRLIAQGIGADILRDVTALEAEGALRPPPPETESEGLAAGRMIQRLTELEPYFRERRDLPADAKITSVRRLSGGFSRETYAVAFGDHETIIIRKAKPDGILDGLCASLPQEEPFLRLAFAHDVPVAEPYWTELDTAVLGQPFLVTSFVGGRNIGDTLKADKPVPPEIIRNIAHMLAGVHGLPWRDAVQSMDPEYAAMADIDGAGATRALLGNIDRYWRGAMSASPSAAALYEWLVRNVPEDGLDPVVTHGDVGFHNMLVRDDRVSALLDWESVFICSPAKDLANVRPFMSAHVPWEQFLGWYAEAGGKRPSDAELHYQGRLRLMMGFIVSQSAVERQFARSDAPDPEFLTLGLPGLTFFLRGIAEEFAG